MARCSFHGKTIRRELVRLLVLSLLTGALAFVLADICGTALSDRYLRNSDYLARHDQKYIDSLQDYVRDNHLRGTDQDALYAWTDENKDVLIQIYNREYGIAFLSYNEKSKIYKTEVSTEFMDQMNEYTVHFSDGDYHVFLMGLYAYRPYNYSFITAVALAVALFLCVFLRGIRRKMQYIARLKEEVEILGGGDLSYQVSVEGNDELADLAENLNQMRLALRKYMDQEARLSQERRSFIGKLSHDIRTPLTTINLYSDLLLQGKYQDEAQYRHLLQRIHSSAEHMSGLMEQLAENAAEDESGDKSLAQYADRDADLLQALPEMASQLRMQEFTVRESYLQDDSRILMNGEALARILDNIQTNIVRYADRGEPVTIEVKGENAEFITIRFENACRDENTAAVDYTGMPVGSGIGMQSVRTLMQEQGGTVEIKRSNDRFQLRLVFPKI